jgi:hypothetical protein
MLFRWILGAALAASSAAYGEIYDFARLAGDLIDLEALSRLDFLPTRMVSSFDRAGGNNDAFVGAWRKGDVYTIAELEGPGVIRRFYSARPGGHLRIYIDGNPTPVVDMKCEEFFSGRHYPFARPLAGPMGGSNYSYFPIPYSKSVKIQTTALRQAEFPYGVYYQVTYQTFPKGTDVGSLALPLTGVADTAWKRVLRVWSNPGVDPKPHLPAQQTMVREVRVEAGKRVEIARLAGAATIDEFHLSLEACDAPLLRSTLLKMRWDDEPRDSVDTPVGDFFANSYNLTPFKSLPMGLTGDGWYSYFSMPFGKRASISLVNESADQAITARVKLVFHRTAGLADNAGYFHAKWRREQTVATELGYRNTTGEYNYRVLDAHGQGRYVGMNFNVYNRHTLWWGEGDPMIFVDNAAWPPAIHGTGTEEYFNDGWGFHQFISAVGADKTRRERNVVPVSGVLVGGVEDPLECFAGNAVFSFHVADAIPFRERILVTFEHGQEQNDLANDYSSTAYWYARPGSRDFFAMRPADERVNVPQSAWPEERKAAAQRYLAWIRWQLDEFAAAIPYEPNNDILARPRAVFLMWALNEAVKLGLPVEERDRMRKENNEFKGTEPERRRNVDRLLVELAGKLGLKRE